MDFFFGDFFIDTRFCGNVFRSTLLRMSSMWLVDRTVVSHTSEYFIRSGLHTDENYLLSPEIVQGASPHAPDTPVLMETLHKFLVCHQWGCWGRWILNLILRVSNFNGKVP